MNSHIRATKIIVAFLTIQMFTNMASAKTEEQKYRVVHSDKDFEIRFYPSTTLATVYSEVDTYKELSGAGFRTLADYIFGGNETDTKISMTSPVHMTIDEKRSSMSFVMPAAYNSENLPKPNDTDIKIEKTEDEYVAAIRFSGYASDDDIKKYSEKLKNLLDHNGVIFYGKFRFLGYNSPYDFIGRRNEIVVSVKWKEEK